MSLEQITQIAKLDHTNQDVLNILALYQEQIISWLNSKKFQAWAQKPYPPLLNPAKIDYAFLNPIHAWVLNLPLPKHYDFITFGSKFSGLDTARGYLMLCGAHGISSSDAGLLTSIDTYIYFYQNLLIYADMKEKDEISSAFLLLDEFVLDNDASKLYSLIDASNALHVVADPISALCASLCARKFRADFIFDDKTSLEKGLELPNSDINSHLSNIKELYHDGFMFQLLSQSMKNLCLKQNSDFSQDKAFATICDIAKSLGLKAPQQKTLPQKGVESDILPLKICVKEFSFYLTSCYRPEAGIYADREISQAFSLANPCMQVLLENANDALVLLKDKELFAVCKERIELASKAVNCLINSLEEKTSQAEILEYLLSHKDSRKLAENMIEQHLIVLNQVAPAIISGFKYYQAFKLLCANNA